MEPNADTVPTLEDHQSTCLVMFGILAVEVLARLSSLSISASACLSAVESGATELHGIHLILGKASEDWLLFTVGIPTLTR
jgi:hypothetical protein